MTSDAPVPTPEQIAAARWRDSSVCLTAGAGSGKTTTLTDRYLYHLDRDGAAVPHILAITFTERAAGQMRKRVRAALKARGPSGAAPLAHLDTAPIQTIHSFCASLLRRYAAEVGVDPAFDILDPPSAAIYRAEAVRSCLRRLILQDPDARNLIVLFGYPAAVTAIDDLIADPDRDAWEEFLARAPAAVTAEWLGPYRSAVLDRYLDHLRVADPKFGRVFAVLGAARPTGPSARSTLAGIRAGFANLAKASDLGAAVEELTELAKVKNAPKKEWPDEASYEAVKDAFAEFRTALPAKLEAFLTPAHPAQVAVAVAVGQQWLRVARAADEEYRRAKRSVAALDFADLIGRARTLVRDHADVRTELQERYRFVLVDEFQDTDPAQYELISRLSGEGFRTGKVFAVGDEKQSIYRFRGAAVDLFRKFRQSVPPAGRLSLTKNFRSRPGILSFVNTVFGAWLPDYEDLVPHREAVERPAVEFLWSLPVEEGGDESAEDRRRREADAIARRIVELRNEERFALRDVCLLFRSMSNVALYEQALLNHRLDYYLVGGRAFFARQEVFDVVNALRTVENPQDGESLVGVLRSPFFGLSDEGVTLIGTHTDGPWAGLHDPTRIARLAADDRVVAERAVRLLTDWRGLKDRLPVARLLLRMFADTGFDAATRFAPLPDRQLANLWKLVDLARDFDRRGMGLAAVVAHFADRVSAAPNEEQAATTPEDDDVVRLMTIHQAKGLEFPVVFVPDLGSETRGELYGPVRWDRLLGAVPKRPYDLRDGDPGAFSEFPHHLGRTVDTMAAWEEELRVLYVACTRAEELLVLSAGLTEDTVAGEGPMLFALDRVYDLAAGRSRTPSGPPVPVRIDRGRDS